MKEPLWMFKPAIVWTGIPMTVPAWIIMESRNRERYRWGGYPAGKPPEVWISSGYMKKADTIEDLAKQCGIETAPL